MSAALHLNQPDHGSNHASLARMAALAVSVEDIFIDRAKSVLQVLMADPAEILSLGLVAGTGSYTRRFLFGDGMMSAWAFAWGPGAATSIHDHHCPCVVAVLDGAVTESWYEPAGGETVRLVQSMVRTRGHIAALRPLRPNIHRMSNDGESRAVTVHIYGFNHKVVTSSIDREYRLTA
ncbi:MAG TPA: cysteine dioxygenase family protein [Acidiphilium sp.]